jgi:hypothetical protein
LVLSIGVRVPIPQPAPFRLIDKHEIVQIPDRVYFFV